MPENRGRADQGRATKKVLCLYEHFSGVAIVSGLVSEILPRVSGCNYKPVPAAILKGQWLNEMGFEVGDQIRIECGHGKLVISLDRERMYPILYYDKESLEILLPISRIPL